MRKTLITINALMLLTGAAGTALACGPGSPNCPDPSIAQTWTQTHFWTDPDHANGVLLNASNPKTSWDFSLAAFVPTFELNNDTVYSFALAIDFQDDRDAANERADIDLGAFSFTSTSSRHDGRYSISDFTHTFTNGEAAQILTDFSLDSLLRLTISALSIGQSGCYSGSSYTGDFYLKSATLTAKGCNFPTPPPPIPTPEPATALMLGTGLVGLARVRHKKRR